MAKVSAKKRRRSSTSQVVKNEDKKANVVKKKEKKRVVTVMDTHTSTAELVQEGNLYLKMWQARNQEESTWKFKKSKQVWLLRWMYRPDIVRSYS